MNNQSIAAGATGRQYNGKMKMSMTFSKIMLWQWSDQPNRNREKPRGQHQQKFQSKHQSKIPVLYQYTCSHYCQLSFIPN